MPTRNALAVSSMRGIGPVEYLAGAQNAPGGVKRSADLNLQTTTAGVGRVWSGKQLSWGPDRSARAKGLGLSVLQPVHCLDWSVVGQGLLINPNPPPPHIVLDLVNPVGAGRWLVGGGWQARLYEGGSTQHAAYLSGGREANRNEIPARRIDMSGAPRLPV